jgi:S1-C subfamily serine protease
VRRLGALIAAAAVAAAGCGGDDGDNGGAAAPKEVETTRVEVVEGLGKRGGFDPQAIYKRLSPGVVTVISIFSGGPAILGGDDQGGLGSGFVIDGDGYVATNAHVVTTGEGSKIKRAKAVYVEFSDGNRVGARIVGTDPNADVALLKVDPSGLELTPLKLGSSDDLTVGEPVATIGSPFGERQSLSVGVVSAVDRAIESLTAFSIGDAIQTDAAINRGNSGGPLLDARGEVIGINAQIRSSSGGGEGVGFAVPVDTARRSLGELRRHGKIRYAFLGVSSQGLYPQLAKRLGLDVERGALVVKVERDTPADDAGLEAGKDKIDFQALEDIPKGGDVIVAVDGARVEESGDLADLISAKRPGERVRLRVVRDDDTRTVSVKLAERPAQIRPSGG